MIGSGLPAILRTLRASLLLGFALPACLAAQETSSGFTDTLGGLGGRVIKVTTLDFGGPGSLAEAIAAKGPRVVVFEVGGVIDLGKKNLYIAEPYLTVAGATAPSPGITLIRGGLTVSTHDVVIEHLRLRMGDAGSPKNSGFEPDAGTYGPDAHDIVFDHLSVSWAVDENLSVSGDRYGGPLATSRRVTIRHSIIAEGLANSVHSKGSHSMGTLIHDNCTEIAVIGNFYAHNNERNPWFKGGTSGAIVNNLIYNPGKWAIRVGYVANEWKGRTPPPQARVSVQGNVMRFGADTPPNQVLAGSNSDGEAWLFDNLAFKADGQAARPSGGALKLLPARPVWPDGLKALPTSQTEAWVLATAGARPKDRDASDRRLIEEYRKGGGGFVDSQEERESYPSYAPTYRALAVPETPEGVQNWLSDMKKSVEE